ncbi:uncharacterized protein MELLADRAFT_85892 [Melampsora larici-populina 98AG31]|uniref:Tet-like 2OG-Fe(II) oxygenase domain-containing protein n=1 Tax=Melampsora larici-populina (strain 98AG31 / pathotype 3-4-7) TaxID=747676 RepID=F4RK12_MELLP|nr:uncharacterized protein MELLADRAFT_85892 [Melampsora larici-populina 98AG31]EGG07267.1 hypothetical protein MELLADRAFT_85892 [Melampsora larici-populina 98AG31]
MGHKYKSPSTRKARANHTINKNMQDPERARPLINARAASKAELIEQYGLPSDTKFLFFKKGRWLKRARFTVRYGTVVCLDADTSELLLVARFVERDEVNEDLFESYNHSISTIYQHAKARGIININGASYKEKRRIRKHGTMYAFGLRPGYEKGVAAGTYTWNEETAADYAKMEADLKRQGNLPEIENFIAERFSGLSYNAFQSNSTLALITDAPSWANQSFYVSPNSQVFSSNITMTCDEFTNKKHKDHDATDYAFGFFCLIDRATGELYEKGSTVPRGNVIGARFVLDDYNLEVDLDSSDGVLELIWNTQVNHHTSPSKTYDANNQRVAPADAEVTRFACSCQISLSLVQRIAKVYALRDGMNEKQWNVYRDTQLHGYGVQAHAKMKALAIKLGIWEDNF